MPAKKKTSPAYHHGDLRQELLTHASALLDQAGADALSLRDLAKRAAVSPAAPYRHFESKDALLAALSEQGFEQLEAKMVKASSGKGDPMTQLLALAKAYLELAAKRPHFFRMMFSADLGPSRVHEGIFRACDRVYGRLLALVKSAASSEGSVAPAEEQVLLFWSLLHGYAMLLIDRRLDDLDLAIRAHVDLLQRLLTRALAGGGPMPWSFR